MRITITMFFIAISIIACTETETPTRKALVQNYRGEKIVAHVDPIYRLGDRVEVPNEPLTCKIIAFEDTTHNPQVEFPEEIQEASKDSSHPDLFVGYMRGDTLVLGYYHPKK